MAAAPKQNFPLIQALRASAAMSVAISHILHDAQGLGHGSPSAAHLYTALPWTCGVDIFFVISGFVIAHASRGLFAQPNASRIFLARRIARIVPLYWAMTTLFLLNLWLLPGAIHGQAGGLGFILKSYAFIPAARADGMLQPVFGLGWTLNYEMFFYLVFAPFLGLPRRKAVLGAVTCLVLFVLAGACIGFPGIVLQFWSSPIILEFCAGMLLAQLPGRVALPAWVRALIALAAITALCLHLHEGPERFYAWGIPAAALVFGAITGQPASRLPLPELWLVRLGDASYALYLVHPFIMRGVGLLWRHMHGGALVYAVLCLALAQAAALALHQYAERPANTWLRARLEPKSLIA